MPKGKGGFTKIGLWVDVYSQHVWGEKLKKSATGASMVKKFENICTTFIAPEAFMADGSPEFDNAAVWEACSVHGTELQIIPAYSPWVNRLIKGMNRKLLGILKRLCAPDLGEDEYEKMGKDNIPTNWPDHFDDALEYLNKHILPHLKFTLNELLLGLVINTAHTPKSMASEEPKHADVIVQMAYMDQLHLDGYAVIVEHTEKCKVEFDRKVTVRAPKEVIFKVGQLMQVYRNNLNFTFQVGHKMEPKWSAPQRVVSCDRNSYKLETLEGLPIVGTQLHKVQEAIEEMRGEEEKKADRVEVVVMGADGNGANMLFESMELVEGREASGSPPLDSSHVE
ncbi:hypothetical protein H0H87_004416 [Tephrocybe sp. NHM501043]|nr:hypothetical protein H0H87_004416 [Tephrocybe sp. NHM501043]